MPNTQTSVSGRKGSGQSAARATRRGGARAAGSKGTVANDDTYGVVSVLYHALQGAETIDKYIEDARAAENDQLISFFEDCKAKQNEIALESKRLLAEQLIDLEEDAEEAAEGSDDDE